MKIALMTIWREKNFGAEMQCYATVKALRQLGHEVEVIDFRLSDSANSFKSHIHSAIESLTPQHRSFEGFWRKYIPSTKHFRTKEQLISQLPPADIYLVGSDQVWNPTLTKDRWSTYFLDILPADARRVAYASSIGEEKWIWPAKKDAAGELLKRFAKIGVREETGRKILTQTFGIHSTVVLDPTLLHTDYSELAKPGNTTPTLCYYPLRDNTEMRLFTHRLAEKLQLRVIDANEKRWIFGRGRLCWRRTTIQEWLKSIGEASLVVTPSFHGLAFSLIYQRQFIVILSGGAASRSSRMLDLLAKLGLSHRCFTSVDEAEKSEIWNAPIDYSIVTPKLSALRQSSMEFLEQLTKV